MRVLKYKYWIPAGLLLWATTAWMLSSISSLEMIILSMGLFIWDAIFSCAESLNLIHEMKLREKYPEEFDDYDDN